MRQDYTAEFLQAVLGNYENLGNIKKSFIFTSGYENSNYYVETDNGKFVIKIFEGVGVAQENILFELQAMNVSFEAGVKTPSILKSRQGELVVTLESKQAVVMNYIEGENMQKRVISDDIAYVVGQETGKMDNALALLKSGDSVRQNYEWDLKNFLALEPKRKYLDKVFNQQVFEEVFADFRKIKSKFDALPKTVIHNDITLHNILVKDGELQGIIDFSDLAFSPRIQNVAVPMSQMFFCYNWQPQQAPLFINGYQGYHSFSSGELALLYDLTCARYVTIVIEFNYWNKELFGEDKQRSETVSDFYQFLLKFKEVGKEKFNELINI